MANEWILSLTGAEATRFNLAKKAYAANVIRHYLTRIMAYSMIPTIDMMGGVSLETVRFYKMAAHKKDDHGDNPTQTLTKKRITVTLEDEEMFSGANLSKKDQMIVHFDANGNIAKSAGEAMGQLYDVQTYRQLQAAARTPADGNFPGGQQVTETLVTDIAGTYEMSLTGSRKLQDNIKTAHRYMIEDDVPEELEKHWFMKKREHDVLQQDPTLMSADYVGRDFADKIHGKLLMIDGAWIHPTNNYPQTDASVADDDTPSKNGTDAYLVDGSDSVAACLTSEALVKNEPEAVSAVFYWSDEKRHWVIGSVGFKTIETWRPECAAEIRVA